MKTLKTRVNEIVALQEKGRTSALKICKVIAGISTDWDEISTDVSLVQERTMQKFIADELGYNKGTVSRMVGVASRFLEDSGEVQTRMLMTDGHKWNASQLFELLTLDDETINAELETGGIQSTMTAKEIREAVNDIKSLTQKDAPEAENVESEELETEDVEATAENAISENPNSETEKALVIGEFVSAMEIITSLHVSDTDKEQLVLLAKHLDVVLRYIENH